MEFASRLFTDPVEELRLRRWARENYVSVESRDPAWHAVVLDEMCRKDEERAAVHTYSAISRRIVPLAPDHSRLLHGPHRDLGRLPVLLRVPVVE